MTLWAAVVALMAHTLMKLGTRAPYIFALIVFAAFFPLQGNYAIAMVKDSPFSLAVAALAPILLRIWHSKGLVFKKPGFFTLALAIFVATGSLRNNGLLLLLLLIPLIAVIAKRARALAIICIVISTGLAIIPGKISEAKVGAHTYVESVGIPLQMIGHTFANDASCFSDAELNYFSDIQKPEKWAETYQPYCVDFIKDDPDFDKGFLQETKDEFPKHFVAATKSCPTQFATAYLLHTENYWSPFSFPVGETEQSVFTSVASNSFGGKEELIQSLANRGVSNHSLLPGGIGDSLGKFWETAMAHAPGIGVWLWAALALLLASIYKRRYEAILIFIPMLVIWSSLLVASPYSAPFRYVAFVILTLPFAAAYLFGTLKAK